MPHYDQMPEGDVVWRTASRLNAALAGRVLLSSDLRWPSLATVDLSGRPYLAYDLRPTAGMLGTWDTQLIPEFFGALTDHGRFCLHLHELHGRNSHHVVEAGFKAFARALRQAIRVTGSGVPSTKGSLE